VQLDSMDQTWYPPEAVVLAVEVDIDLTEIDQL
jgi:hypothetical protein